MTMPKLESGCANEGRCGQLGYRGPYCSHCAGLFALVADAARAEETFDVDELERYAEECRA